MNDLPQNNISASISGVVDQLNVEKNTRLHVQNGMQALQQQLDHLTASMATSTNMTAPVVTLPVMGGNNFGFGPPPQPQIPHPPGMPVHSYAPQNPALQPTALHYNCLSQINMMNARLQAFREEFDKSGNNIDDLYAQLDNIRDGLNEQKQYDQRNNLIGHGWDDVPIAPQKPTQEFAEKFTDYVVDKLNTLFPNIIEGGITPRDIDDTHIYRTRKSKRESHKQLVIIRFCSRLLRNKIFSRKKELRNTGFSITEHLTSFNLGLLKEAQYRLGDARKAWTHYGKVLMNIGDVIKSAKNYYELDKLVPPRNN